MWNNFSLESSFSALQQLSQQSINKSISYPSEDQARSDRRDSVYYLSLKALKNKRDRRDLNVAFPTVFLLICTRFRIEITALNNLK